MNVKRSLRNAACLAILLYSQLSLAQAGAASRQSNGIPTQGDASCSIAGELSFVCGADRPEDLVRVPGTRWVITSGFSRGSGLKLLDTRRASQRRWYVAAPDQIRLDAARYPDCATPPDPVEFNARGLSLRQTRKGQATLHVVNHGGREAIEVFDLRFGAGKAEPRLTWRGCLMMPPGHVGNAVATFRDGTVLTTVLTRPGTTITDFERGLVTGGVYSRRPTDTMFRLIPGTELPGNNGLETSKNGREFYVVAFGLRAIAIFDRGSSTGPKAIVKAPGFMPDNVHYDGRFLIAAGMNTDEPSCGGPRKIVDGVADRMLCPRGYRVATFDPRRRKFKLLVEGERNAKFNGVSSAAVVGRTLWLGSYQADRIAYRQFQR